VIEAKLQANLKTESLVLLSTYYYFYIFIVNSMRSSLKNWTRCWKKNNSRLSLRRTSMRISKRKSQLH
jgi:hypothetical protein